MILASENSDILSQLNMLVIKLQKVCFAAAMMEQCRSIALLRRQQNLEILADNDLEMIASHLRLVLENCQHLGLEYTSDQIERFLQWDLFGERRISYQKAENMLIDIMTRFYDDLKKQGLGFIIEKPHVPLYERPEEQFSEEVLNKFPSARTDIEEAGRCFSLERYSATVFHLMHILELGLVALAKPFGIQSEKGNWQNIIDQIEKAVKNINAKNWGPTWRDDQEYYSTMAVEFRFFKDAWRNKATHGREHYTKPSADNIYRHVRVFMSKAAERLSE